MKVSRRQALGTGAAGLIGAAAAAASLPAGRTVQLPNILWLVSEDNNPYIGAYGDKLAHTPNIDALAARGIRFRNSYSDAPVCAPSRFAMLTGVNPESCSPAQHMRADARLPRGFRTYPELMRQAGYFCINNPKTDYNCDVDPKAIWDIQGRDGHWRNAPKGKPFLCVLNTGTSHEQHVCDPTAGKVTPADVRVPAFLPDTPTIRQDFASYYNIMEQMDGEIGNWLAQLAADGLAEDTIVFYYGDNGGVLPRSKRYCYEEGLRVPLIVYVPPKWQHLAPAPAGSVLDAPVTLIDLPATLLSIAGIAQPAQMTGKPLVGQRIGAPATYAFGFRDRMDERYDLVRTVTDGRFRYIRNYMPHRALGQHVGFEWQMQASYREWDALHRAGRLTETQDRFFRPKPFEELYDVAADPDQVVNLIDRPEAMTTTRRLRAALDRHMVSINDNGFLPEGGAGEGYFESRDATVYPLRTLMTVAAAAARRDPRNLSRFVRLLASPAEAVRLWAARGLLMLGPASAPAMGDLRKVMTADPSAPVRITAAETLVVLGEPADAVALLGRLADGDNPTPTRLYAFDALTAIGSAALPALAVIQRTADAPSGPPGTPGYPRQLATYLKANLSRTFDPGQEAIGQAACRAALKGGKAFMGPPASAGWIN